MSVLHELAGGVAHPAPQRRSVPLWRLLTALLLAPASFSTQVLVDYVIAADSCTLHDRPAAALVAITVMTFVGAMAGLAMAVVLWRTVRDEKGGSHARAAEVGEGRTRFIVLCAMVFERVVRACVLTRRDERPGPRSMLQPATRTLALVALLLPVAAGAARSGDHDSGWSFDPLVVALIAVPTVLYVWGLARAGAACRAFAPRWRIACWFGAGAVLWLALLSPLDALADGSFAWHMGQHLALMLVAAPLLAASNAHLVILHIFNVPWRRRLGRFIGAVPGVREGGHARAAPWIAALVFAAGLWLWHAPALYDAALADETVHTFEHLTFLITAAIFWRMVSTVGDRRLDPGSAILLVTLVALQGNLMAALITLAPTPIYAAYRGPGALSDQQLAGLLMWVPAGVVYLASTGWAIHRLIAAPRRGRFAAAAPPPVF